MISLSSFGLSLALHFYANVSAPLVVHLSDLHDDSIFWRSEFQKNFLCNQDCIEAYMYNKFCSLDRVLDGGGSGTLTICQTSGDVIEKLKKFRFQKIDGTCAIILKIDRKEAKIVIDEELSVCSVEDVVATLSEREPRFIIFSYKVRHSDNRISYPLCLIFFSPQGCSPDIQMMYAGSRNNLAKEAEIGKNFEIRDLDELTDEFILEKLKIA
uniref:ADF-H domain-containing protein n=1 Tax=Romanomermis culicivorax TaxID=13658 RepID=A0A915L993_ROMCU